MTFRQYMDEVIDFLREPENQPGSMGRALLEVLHQHAPNLYSEACDHADPFVNENCVPEFLQYVRDVLG